jgi:cardiolipin synthase
MRSVNFVADNDIQLLECGLALFPALLAAIRAARHDIFFETYIYADDQQAREITEALIEAARREVRVRVIIDWFGTGHRQCQRLAQAFASAGVRARIFNPWFKRGVTRTHRKIAVIDRAVAFVGGINVNDDWVCDYDPDQRLPAPRWDFAVQVRGPLVAPIYREAQAQWARVGRLPLFRRVKLFRELRESERSHGGGPMHAGFVVRDNLRNRMTIQRAYLHALGHAHHRVLIANPYFAPGHKLRKALAMAAQRGVEVTLVIGVGEIWLQDMVARSFYPKLLAAGVKLYEYRKTQLHAKVAVVDDDWATVGSSNCDGLSLFLNQEANVVVRDQAFARQLAGRIAAAAQDSVQICSVDFAHVGWARRALYGAAYFFYKLAMRIFAIGYA